MSQINARGRHASAYQPSTLVRAGRDCTPQGASCDGSAH
jgi:hypothetical protein